MMLLGSIGCLTILGPFGTFNDFTFFKRIVYWATILVLCAPVFSAIVPSVLSDHRLTKRLSYWQRFVCAVLIGSFFAFWIVLAAEAYFRDIPDTYHVLRVFSGVLIIRFILCLVRFASAFSYNMDPRPYKEVDIRKIRFFKNYPDLSGSKICRISMEDHYARVVMETTEVSLHVSMNKLVKLLENYPGMRIHRSHWVAFDEIQRVARKGRGSEMVLNDGTRFPIGGSYLNQIKRVCHDRRLESEL